MDGTAAISSNLDALKRIVAGLVGMAGLTIGQSPPLRGRCPAGQRGVGPESATDIERPTLPRHLRLAILRLLRPAEAAARRLIIAAARGLIVTLPYQRKRAARPATMEPQLRRFGIAVVASPADLARTAAAGRTAAIRAARPRAPCLPLFDPLKRFRSNARRTVPAHAAPRILFPGFATPHRLPPPPSPDDPVDATRLAQRLAALAAALDDLPGQARRFARWKARRDAARKGPAPGNVRRTAPLRPGRPPGGRLSRYDPSATQRRRIREVDEILAHAHALALYALAYPDTS
jgi:hypothetical protein